MAGKLSPKAQAQLAALAELEKKIQHLYSLVETFAAERKNPDSVAQTVKRGFGRLKIQLMGAGFDTMSQLCGSMEIAARRGLAQGQKARILREGVGSLRFQLDMTQRGVLADEEARQRLEEKDA
ncbi:MAG: hypothetical protein WEB88_11480 [Gemmatimonadota bacterium]